MRQKQLSLVFLLVVGGLAGRWWYSQKGERPVTYITTVVGRGPITRLVVATGTVNPVTTGTGWHLCLRADQGPLCRFQFRRQKGPACGPDRPTPISG